MKTQNSVQYVHSLLSTMPLKNLEWLDDLTALMNILKINTFNKADFI